MRTFRFTLKRQLLFCLGLYITGSIMTYNEIGFGAVLCAIAVGLPIWFVLRFFLNRPGSLVWFVLVGILGLALLGCAAWSASMYAGLFAQLAPAAHHSPVSNFDWFLTKLPIIGHLFSGFNWLFTRVAIATQGSLLGILGVIFFVCAQTLEIMPVLIHDSLPFKGWIITQLSRFTYMTPPKTSPAFVAEWANDYNDTPRRIIKGFDYFSYAAYAVDTVVSVIGAPLIHGGYGNWSQLRYTFNAGDVNWSHVLLCFITVAGFTLAAKALVAMFNALFFALSGGSRKDK